MFVMNKSSVAKDLMSSDVAWVDADMSILDVARFLDENRIHGAPVVGADGTLCGVVSTTDIVRALTEEAMSVTHQTWFGTLDNDDSGFALDLDEVESTNRTIPVTEIMSHELVTVAETTPVRNVARVMLDEGVQRVIVIDTDDKVTGIIAVSDLLRLVAGTNA